MERNRKDRNGGVLTRWRSCSSLPADLVAGLPHLEMMGSRQLYLEHHTGILAYSDEQIDVNTTGRRAAGPGRPLGPDGHDGGGAADRRGHCRRGVGEVTPC